MRKITYGNESIRIDNGLFFGKGVFETILVKEEAIFLEEHIKRLNNSINELNIGEEVEIDYVSDFIRRKNIKNKALKITVTEENLIFSEKVLSARQKVVLTLAIRN